MCVEDPFSQIRSHIRLPGRIPKRGRPKGSDLTVIGLPKKKKLAEGPVAFLRQHPQDQERGMFIQQPTNFFVNIVNKKSNQVLT